MLDGPPRDPYATVRWSGIPDRPVVPHDTNGERMLKRVAMIFGVVFILVAILGFMQTGMSNMESDPALAPTVLGLFPVNVLHNIVHLLFGVWGIAASRSYGAAATYAKVGGGIYALLALLGFVSPSMFGLVPIGGHDIWLHAVLAIGLLGAGFALTDDAVTARV
jgi:hypothetical protein